MDIVAGVDGGGSKTRVLIAGDDGATISEAEGSGSAVRPGRADRSAAVIAELVSTALANAGLSDTVPRMLFIGVAGIGREAERQALLDGLFELRVARDIIVEPDGSIALNDAFDDGPGLLLIAGTGSVCVGRGPTGSMARCGGWGPVIGDEGSGAWIGRRALSIVAAAADGREPETLLSRAVLAATGTERTVDLVPWAAAATPADLALLAPVVAEAADGGDLRANSLVSLAAEELLLHVRALARQVFGDERASIPLALSGGLLGSGSTLRRRLENRLRVACPGVHIHAEAVDAARGAVKGALRAIAASTPAARG
ncbi:MAG: BadF/BadG/BcrA/BcrD ATPase family protein [Gemmatimonadaceae bacterium]